MFDVHLMRRLSAAAAVSETEVDELRQHKEAFESSDASFERIDPLSPEITGLSDADIAALVSPEARDLVIGFEVGSRQLYEKKYIEPEWPKGASGVTIGIGYDVGYYTAEELRRHWDGLIDEADIAKLIRAVGVKGASAGAIVSQFRGIRVPWDAAIAAYERSTMPKYGRLALRAFPNALDLKGHSFGALFSLVFNRGAAMDGERRKEMRNIRDACGEGRFDDVPQEIRDMCRLWAGQGLSGLVKRRKAEAVLFERGLELMRVVAVAVNGQAESVDDVARFDGDGRYADEDEEALIAREAGAIWDDVRWAPDDDAPDYHHIRDRSLTGKPFELDARGLELLIRANSFEPTRDNGRIIFALRGAELVTSLTSAQAMTRQQDRASLTLRDCRPNHKEFKCVIGVYDLTTNRLSGFASSTAPNRGAVAGYYANRQSGNMMPTGCYSFEVGWHLVSKPERKMPGCLVENGRQKCVHRSINDMVYDLKDLWENHRLHGDNLHPAKGAQSAKFSSLGCLVVAGDYKCASSDRAKGTHTGEWALFRQALGLTKAGTGDHGRRFDVVLLTGLEAAIASQMAANGTGANEALVTEALGRLRQGSRGERVKRLQRGLGLAETGVLSHDVVKAWTDRQKKDFSDVAQGVFSPDADTHYAFRVFEPSSVLVSSVANGARVEAIDAGASGLDQLYYEVGLHAEAARRNPSADASSLESLGAGGALETINLEFGFADLTARGASLVRTFECQLQQKICANNGAALVDQSDVRAKLDDAARGSAGSLKKYVAQLIGAFVPGAALFPPSLNETIADAIVSVIVQPIVTGITTVAGDQIELSAQWLCESWCARLGAPSGGTAAATDSAAAPGPSAAQVQPAPGASRVVQFIDLIESASAGAKPDGAGVRRYIRDLRSHLDASGDLLDQGAANRLLAALCDTPFMDQLPGVIGGDPYALMRDVEAALGKSPPDKASAKKLLGDLHSMLADARMKIQPQEVKRLLKTLRGAKMFDELSLMCDRFAARDPELLSVVTTSYAQGLIDSGRIVAGIEMLHAAEDLDILSDDEAKEAAGILGRGHKQIYVNHIKTPSDAVALRDGFSGQLGKAIECYGRHYDPQRPGENSWQGLNYISLLKRAERDRVKVQAKGEADALARNLIAALEPKAAGADDPWLLATLGEAELALGRYDKAAEYLGHYARHPRVEAFQLNGTVRQLEEVWQIQAGPDGAGAILANLKGALAQAENGFVTLKAEERRAIAKAENIEFQHHFETTTRDGKYINFGLLKRIVACGASVAAIQIKMGHAGRTVGTGFLVHGPDFSPKLAREKSYILTNAHVIWDHGRNQGSEDKAISPDTARVIFENDLIDGRTDAYSCSVVWQSPSNCHDATLLELDRRVAHIEPLQIAPSSSPLVVASEPTPGTRLAVLGHPLGGSLALGVSGSLEEMKGTLVDRGPRARTNRPVFLHYITPTEPGCSGSPVLETENWRVVGLHHAGYIEGSTGLAKLGGQAGTNMANEGIWIESIREALKDELSPETRRGGRRRWWNKSS